MAKRVVLILWNSDFQNDEERRQKVFIITHSNFIC